MTRPHPRVAPRLLRPVRTAGPEPVWDAAALRVLAHDDGPLRVVGGPGTGKTALLLASVAARIEAGVDPERILLLVGSRRAAADLRDRLTGVLPGTRREVLVRTVHSYAFGVLRLHAAREGDPPPRLLAGAEQDVVVRDLLVGEIYDGAPDSGWPERLRPALPLPGFAAELRELLLRAAERGLGPDELADLGREHDVPAWTAAGTFFRTYEHVTLLRGSVGRGAPQATAPALDAAELVAASLDALAFDRELLDAERARVQHLLVDDAQDLDPQQMELVRALGATARTVLLAGDPDQAVLTFRGADPEGMEAIDADTVVLRVDRRSTPAVRAATERIASRLAGTGEGRRRVGPDAATPGDGAGRDGAGLGEDVDGGAGPSAARRAAPDVSSRGGAGTSAAPGGGRAGARDGIEDADAGRHEQEPADEGPADADGEVQVRVFTSAAQEAAWVADQLRRAHLTRGVPWSRMAVLSRSVRRALPTLRRALLAAGVPIAAPPDELPVARQPAVVPLLMVLRYAARPDQLDADAATALLTSPLGSADPLRMRRLRRGLLRVHAARATAADAATAGAAAVSAAADAVTDADATAADDTDAATDAVDGRKPEPGSDPLLVAALRAAAKGEPNPLSELPANETAPLRRVGALLAIAGKAVRAGESAEEVLWRVWQRCGLGQRWAESSARGGPGGAAADRDLDAVLALFDAAARHADRLPGSGVAAFTEYLTEQHLPTDTLADQSQRGEAVVLLTAHAARGREWDVVAVPGVQEGAWPDLRLRGSLLGNERLVDLVSGVAFPGEEVVSRIAPLLAEERRLFYSACSRARHTLLVSGVQGEDEQPSRFLDELDPLPAAIVDRPVHRPSRSLMLAELVGELRRAVTEPPLPPDDEYAPSREARRHRAAEQLARLAEAGVPGADPQDWYGLAEPSSDQPLRDPAEVVPVSPSDVEKIMRCPLRWVLERHGGGEVGALTAVTGSLVHALVQAGAAGAGRHEIDHALRTAWSRLDTGAPWFSRRELTRVQGMLAAFDGWVRTTRAEGLQLVAVEHAVQLDLPPQEVEVGTPGPALRLRGRVDRLEVDAQGRPVVIDVKTGKVAVSAKLAAVHPQLAVYQLAAALGAFGELVDAAAGPGGARLVYVADQKANGDVKEPQQPPLDADDLAQWESVLRDSAAQTSGSVFVARLGPDCERCPVRSSCPAHGSGRPVTEP